MANSFPVARKAELAHLGAVVVRQRDKDESDGLFGTSTTGASDPCYADTDRGLSSRANSFGHRLRYRCRDSAMTLNQGIWDPANFSFRSLL